ncbi:curli production assembly/transport component CsgF [Reichenbachiella agariperforans]|uniref:curli production assembly/transport component CsgF n=1 Tax=Reichenbachiella agariperforans TaxID=156994 RepID=UPI0009337304|nr:curli production assembly/transport component CsgF [Reichenbachiella agariperforans]
MNHLNTKLTMLIGILWMTMSGLQAQDFVYKPINPAFGGDTFNYNWLLSSAQEQNQHQNQSSLSDTDLDNFEENLNRQVLNLLSRELTGDLFGENGLENGLYSIGSFEIEVSSNTDGINVYVVNTSDGSETLVTVPYY